MLHKRGTRCGPLPQGNTGPHLVSRTTCGTQGFVLSRPVLSKGLNMRRKPTDIVQVKLRLMEGIRQGLAQAAKRSGRSLNGEIAWRLERSFEAEGVADLKRQIEELSTQVQALILGPMREELLKAKKEKE